MSAIRPMLRLLPLALACGLASPLSAQDPDDDEIQKLGPVDRYTEGDAEAMAALGVVRYGPFPWADNQTTADVDRVLGENRVLWMETAHFRIGLNLKTVAWPERPIERKGLQAECKALNKRLRRIPSRPKKIDPWLRMHLFASRVEKAYADFEELVGIGEDQFHGGSKVPGKGDFLGMPDKFLLLLFEKRSDMARYMDRFCGVQDDTSMRFYHDKTDQLILCVSAEGMEGFNEAGLHGHVVYAVWQNLLNGYKGYGYPLPPWFAEGISHWYSRQVPNEYLNVQIKDEESVAQEDQHKWPMKVRRRAQHEGAFYPFEEMVAWAKWNDMGYHAHAQSWSRIDYLMHVDKAKVGVLLDKLKSVPPSGDFEGQGKQIRAMAAQLLFDLFDLDAQSFDEQWRKWVLKTYPKT